MVWVVKAKIPFPGATPCSELSSSCAKAFCPWPLLPSASTDGIGPPKYVKATSGANKDQYHYQQNLFHFAKSVVATESQTNFLRMTPF